jgi:methylglutaconyl-CoA hydratase
MQHINYKTENRIGTITLNRPDKRNALNRQMVGELKDTFSRAEVDDEVKVIVLKAEGEVFCAGADLAYLQELQRFSHEENLADSNELKELFLKIYTLRKVVIAQVQGHALAGGCGLASICDFSLVVPEARLGYTEVKIGFIPAIVMVFLLRKVGEKNAKQLLLGGELATAEEALAMGLVNAVVEKDSIAHEVMNLANRLIKNNSTQSMEITKQMMAKVQSLSLEDGLAYAAQMNAKARETEDCKKGIAAFLSRQELKW